MAILPGAATLSTIAADISRAVGAPFVPDHDQAVAGGSINRAIVLASGNRRYFVKLNSPSRLPMFEAEADGLAELAASRSVRVPAVLCCGSDEHASWLALEHLDLVSDADGLAALGVGLAQMHRCVAAEFGWKRDNTIGPTRQPNDRHGDWVVFLRDMRLGFQLRLAGANGYGGALQERGALLLERLEAFFASYRPLASLLHGDLWSANAGVLRGGGAAIFDPAVYYGDREADLAMTELFGGFPAGFHHAYRAAWPPDPGYGTRKRLYNLYHLLNHLNLFGDAYLAPARESIEWLLAELR